MNRTIYGQKFNVYLKVKIPYYEEEDELRLYSVTPVFEKKQPRVWSVSTRRYVVRRRKSKHFTSQEVEWIQTPGNR